MGVTSTAFASERSRANLAWYGPGERRSMDVVNRPFAPSRAVVTYVRPR